MLAVKISDVMLMALKPQLPPSYVTGIVKKIAWNLDHEIRQ
jgi:hypothetical protein